MKTGGHRAAHGRVGFGEMGGVHVWKTCLPPSTQPTGGCLSALTAAEEERYARIRDPEVRIRQRSSRARLRWILAHYLGCPAADVPLVLSAHGKPCLAPGFEDQGISFSVAHSEDCGLYAVGFGVTVGVDVERIRPEFDWAAIAADHFTPREQERVRRGTLEEQGLRFFQMWARKEACLKALGIGLSQGLQLAEVSGSDDTAEFVVSVAAPWNAVGQTWYGRDLGARTGFAAALVSNRALHRVSWFDWGAATMRPAALS